MSRLSFLKSMFNLVEIQGRDSSESMLGKRRERTGKEGAHRTYTEGKGTRNECHDSLPDFILRSHDTCMEANG